MGSALQILHSHTSVSTYSGRFAPLRLSRTTLKLHEVTPFLELIEMTNMEFVPSYRCDKLPVLEKSSSQPKITITDGAEFHR